MSSPFQRAPRSSERRTWRARGRAMLFERLGLKATALLIAVLLWFVVGARQPTESYVSVRLEPELDSTLELLDRPPPLRALVAGRAADIVKLYASPPVLRRTIGGDAPDTLVLDVSPADVHLPPEVASDVHVLDVQPRKVTLRFGASATRRVAVLNAGRIHVAGDTSRASDVRVRFAPETVRITGPRRAVRQLRGVYPTALTISVGDTMPHVAELDTAGLGVRVHPTQVKVKVLDTAVGPSPRRVASP